MSLTDESIRQYVTIYKPYLYILTPCYGSMCFVNYISCLLETVKVFNKYGIEFQVEFCRNDSLVSRARNNLVARAMTNERTTHIMFIDTDITWSSNDIIKLMMTNEMLVGGIYPLKNINWNKLNDIQKWKDKRDKQTIIKNLSDEQLIQHNVLQYNVNYNVSNNQVSIEKNLIDVRHLATGFMMIRRETIETMQKAFPSTKYTDDVSCLEPHENKHAYALFDCGVIDDHYYSEDFLFCQRWINMGGKVKADITINLYHTGIYDFKGSLLVNLVTEQNIA